MCKNFLSFVIIWSTIFPFPFPHSMFVWLMRIWTWIYLEYSAPGLCTCSNNTSSTEKPHGYRSQFTPVRVCCLVYAPQWSKVQRDIKAALNHWGSTTTYVHKEGSDLSTANFWWKDLIQWFASLLKELGQTELPVFGGTVGISIVPSKHMVFSL